MNLRKTVVIGSALIALVGLLSFPRLLLGSDHARAKELIQQACVQCHRLEGKAESRFNLRAPDLIWAGSKYQRPWLIRWLTGKEAAALCERLSMGSQRGSGETSRRDGGGGERPSPTTSRTTTRIRA